MHGPPLSPSEVTTALKRAVRQLEILGVARETAIAAVAVRHGADHDRVAFLADGVQPARASVEEA